MKGEKTAFLSLALEFPELTSVVAGLQPSGAVAPKQVSRRKTLLVLMEAPSVVAGCDSKTTKRASSVMEGARFTPASDDPSVAYEILRADGEQLTPASIPRQVSASTMADDSAGFCTAVEPLQASNATKRPSAEIIGRPL